ncbi:extracellular solute-binding protein [Cohnella caldifontis]|uniref:extracellular solute-binding protein n=1 Tax=Cohnella caldifontis TaxID=3027471 RepID=UPI0023ECC747|nr:extracellular solute-binding protein [Cohnella sp. YIM B05605]
MKKAGKKAFGLLICAMLLGSVLAACSSESDAESGGSASAPAPASDSSAPASASASEKPVTIRIFNRVNAQVVIDDNPVIKEAEKLAGVKLEVEAPPINNYQDKLQVMMASGDLPDLIYNWAAADSNMETWAANGLLAPLDDKIGNYPNLMKNITKEMWDSVKSVNDGHIYLIPRPNIVNHWGYMINQTWLDKLGLKAPTTLDEMLDVCRAFVKNDPDGNGKPDTYCLSFSNPTLGNNTIWNASNFLASAFALPTAYGVKDTDGQYKLREKMTGYLPYLTYLKQLNDEKLIDPEFLINKIYVDQDKLNQNRVGIIYSHQYGVMGNLSKNPDSDKLFTYHAPLKDKDGAAHSWVGPAIWGGWMISKDSKNVDAVLKFLDWGNTPEATQLFQLGLKGMTYDSYDPATRAVSRTPDQAARLAQTTSTYMTVANAIDGNASIIEGADTPERMQKFNDQLNAAMQQIKVVNVPGVRSPKILNLNNSIPDLVKKKDDEEMKYVLGKITLEQYRSFLEKEWFPATADAEKEYVDYMNQVAP